MDPETVAAARAVIARNYAATVQQIAEANFSHTVAPLCANLAALHAGLSALGDAIPPSPAVQSVAVHRSRSKPAAVGHGKKRPKVENQP